MFVFDSDLLIYDLTLDNKYCYIIVTNVYIQDQEIKIEINKTCKGENLRNRVTTAIKIVTCFAFVSKRPNDEMAF